MNNIRNVRIDKFLWAMRLYKTRGIASDACRMGRVAVNGNQVKPSHTIAVSDFLSIKKPPVTFIFRVLMVIENRQPAKLVNNYLEDITPENEKAKLGIQLTTPVAYRRKGMGRPTKKERRLIDKWKDDPGAEGKVV
jgi:ribosome-associated heat shock protein Hsp15